MTQWFADGAGRSSRIRLNNDDGGRLAENGLIGNQNAPPKAEPGEVRQDGLPVGLIPSRCRYPFSQSDSFWGGTP